MTRLYAAAPSTHASTSADFAAYPRTAAVGDVVGGGSGSTTARRSGGVSIRPVDVVPILRTRAAVVPSRSSVVPRRGRFRLQTLSRVFLLRQIRHSHLDVPHVRFDDVEDDVHPRGFVVAQDAVSRAEAREVDREFAVLPQVREISALVSMRFMRKAASFTTACPPADMAPEL